MGRHSFQAVLKRIGQYDPVLNVSDILRCWGDPCLGRGSKGGALRTQRTTGDQERLEQSDVHPENRVEHVLNVIAKWAVRGQGSRAAGDD